MINNLGDDHDNREEKYTWECDFCGNTTATEFATRLPYGRCQECGGDSWSIQSDNELMN